MSGRAGLIVAVAAPHLAGAAVLVAQDTAWQGWAVYVAAVVVYLFALALALLLPRLFDRVASMTHPRGGPVDCEPRDHDVNQGDPGFVNHETPTTGPGCDDADRKKGS